MNNRSAFTLLMMTRNLLRVLPWNLWAPILYLSFFAPLMIFHMAPAKLIGYTTLLSASTVAILLIGIQQQPWFRFHLTVPVRSSKVFGAMFAVAAIPVFFTSTLVLLLSKVGESSTLFVLYLCVEVAAVALIFAMDYKWRRFVMRITQWRPRPSNRPRINKGIESTGAAVVSKIPFPTIFNHPARSSMIVLSVSALIVLIVLKFTSGAGSSSKFILLIGSFSLIATSAQLPFTLNVFRIHMTVPVAPRTIVWQCVWPLILVDVLMATIFALLVEFLVGFPALWIIAAFTACCVAILIYEMSILIGIQLPVRLIGFIVAMAAGFFFVTTTLSPRAASLFASHPKLPIVVIAASLLMIPLAALVMKHCLELRLPANSPTAPSTEEINR